METQYRRTTAKVLHTYMRIYSLCRTAHLGTDIKPMLYKDLIRSCMTHPFPTKEHAADVHH
jgi:hypothetical protein